MFTGIEPLTPAQPRFVFPSSANEIRKAKDSTAHKTGAGCCHKGQEVDRIIHLSKVQSRFLTSFFIVCAHRI
jgi:hypothetical protein